MISLKGLKDVFPSRCSGHNAGDLSKRKTGFYTTEKEISELKTNASNKCIGKIFVTKLSFNIHKRL